MAPVNLLRPSCRPWRGGAISLHKVTARLRDLLPPTFEDLDTVRAGAGALARPPCLPVRSFTAPLWPCWVPCSPTLTCDRSQVLSLGRLHWRHWQAAWQRARRRS